MTFHKCNNSNDKGKTQAQELYLVVLITHIYSNFNIDKIA